ncbi:MAG: hypothetical protein SNJ56_00250 [Termitinemataceae bacterium]
MRKNVHLVFLPVFIFVIFLVVPAISLQAQLQLSSSAAKSTAWIKNLPKQDQTRAQQLLATVDTERGNVLTNYQSLRKNIQHLGDTSFLINELLSSYGEDEKHLQSIERWLGLKGLTKVDLFSELQKVNISYTKACLAYSANPLKYEDALQRKGKLLSDFLKPKLTNLARPALQSVVLALASRIAEHPDCSPIEFSNLVSVSENLPLTLYRQWVLALALGSPAGLVSYTFTNVPDTKDVTAFFEAFRQFSAAVQCRQRLRAVVPVVALLRQYPKIDSEESISTLQSLSEALMDYLRTAISFKEIEHAALQDPILRYSLLELWTSAWVLSTRPVFWMPELWPFGVYTPEQVRQFLYGYLDYAGVFVHETQKDTQTFDTSSVSPEKQNLEIWKAIVAAENLTQAFETIDPETAAWTDIAEFITPLLSQDHALWYLLQSGRYAETTAAMYALLERAWTDSPNLSELLKKPHRDVLFILAAKPGLGYLVGSLTSESSTGTGLANKDPGQPIPFLSPELVGLYLFSPTGYDGGSARWFVKYLIQTGQRYGIPQTLFCTTALFDHDHPVRLYIHAAASGVRLSLLARTGRHAQGNKEKR